MGQIFLSRVVSTLGLTLALGALSPVSSPLLSSAWAQDNPEDAPIPDEPVPAAPIPAAPAKPVAPTPKAPTPPPPTATPPTRTAPIVPAAPGDTVTIPRAVWEQLQRDVEELKRARDAQTPAAPVPAPPDATLPTDAAPTTESGSEAGGAGGGEGGVAAPGGRNYLLLPDISFILDSKYLSTSDKRDDGKNSLGLEGEIGIQGYVYPGVKLDSFIVGNPGEDEPFNIEEGFLTFLSARKGLNIEVGRKFAPFGRTGELHPHSWLYSRQFLARQNLVAPENLVGNGINLDYLLPTGPNFFARLSLGAFSNGEASAGRFNTADPSNPFEGGLPTRTGAGLSRFYNARLWMGKSLGEKNEVELGFSRAQGSASIDNLTGFEPTGTDIVQTDSGRVKLSGIDASYRHFSGADKRLLLRTEYFKYSPQGLPTHSANGYYGLANYRLSKFKDIGLLLEGTGFNNASGREKSLSLIYTKQFTEQFYARLMGTHGSRPGDDSYNELRLQFTAGIGPHVHALE